MKIKWDPKILENCKYPVYLGVTLDRTLYFKKHTNKLKEKLFNRNNLLRKLANLKQTALTLCNLTAEYCIPVWARKDWVALNRARTKVGRTGDNLADGRLSDNAACLCEKQTQTMDHILQGCTLGPSCSNEDLLEANDAALQWTLWWRDKI
ncbi:hypothetical protein Pmani_019433 [Petrolisthes manimaculis]|uniref:Uncharacterized protein n=1 Tax=Petrolisthes manimaculis TaxID=1843537 RepID=A0AAE1PIB5_9EUCA|nr:hypothetical protein Pmani_024347 [Petrolisthes manimaculis]KAK4308908.1 hypothetical protein Pmani_019433 [Petrolisthes manimaculis]